MNDNRLSPEEQAVIDAAKMYERFRQETNRQRVLRAVHDLRRAEREDVTA